MDKQELMKKAANQFGGVWPSTDIKSMLVANAKNPSFIDEYIIAFRESKLECYKLVRTNSTWDYLCSKREFEEFVESQRVVCISEQFEPSLQELREAAPEGAEFVAIGDSGICTCYYRDIKEDCYEYCYQGESEWDSNIGTPIQGPLIQLPPEQVDELYTPKVGEEFEYKEDPSIEVYTQAIYCGYVDGDYIVKHHKESPTILTRFHNKPERMRPLKTERKEIESKFVAIATDVIKDGGNIFDIERAIYDAGWRPTK